MLKIVATTDLPARKTDPSKKILRDVCRHCGSVHFTREDYERCRAALQCEQR